MVALWPATVIVTVRAMPASAGVVHLTVLSVRAVMEPQDLVPMVMLSEPDTPKLLPDS